MLKTFAALLSVILLLHTSCYGSCTEPVTAAISDPNAVPGPLPSCHGTPTTGEDREPHPVHDDERCEDCPYVQASNTASLNILKSNIVALPEDIPVVAFRDDHRASMPDSICAEFSGSPPSRQVLRI